MSRTMECREAEEAINASIDGELERGESQRLDMHLRGCASCRRALERARQMSLAIRQSAERLRRRLPGVSFVLGELYQEQVRLDPYLVAEYGAARVVLGIWDGEEVVACA